MVRRSQLHLTFSIVIGGTRLLPASCARGLAEGGLVLEVS